MNYTILFRSRTAPRLPQLRRWRRWWKTRSSRRNTEPASRTSATPRRTGRPWPRWWRWWRACSAGTERSPRRARATSRRTWWTWRQTCWWENEQVILFCILRFIGCKDLEPKEFSQIILHLTYSTSKNSLMIMNIIAMIKQVAGRSFNCIDNEFLSGLSKVISTAGKWSFTLFAISIYPICSFLGIFSNMLVRFVARLYPNTIEMRT